MIEGSTSSCTSSNDLADSSIGKERHLQPLVTLQKNPSRHRGRSDHGPAAQRRIVPLLDRCTEGFSVRAHDRGLACDGSMLAPATDMLRCYDRGR